MKTLRVDLNLYRDVDGLVKAEVHKSGLEARKSWQAQAERDYLLVAWPLYYTDPSCYTRLPWPDFATAKEEV